MARDRPPRGSYFDLHANEVQVEPQTQRERAATALKLGYDGIAMVHQAGPKLGDSDKCAPQQRPPPPPPAHSKC
jgi:hypothetical protein